MRYSGTCPQCGEEWETNHKRKIFCSVLCRGRNNKTKLKTKANDNSNNKQEVMQKNNL